MTTQLQLTAMVKTLLTTLQSVMNPKGMFMSAEKHKESVLELQIEKSKE